MDILAADCLRANSWVCGKYLSTRRDELLTAVQQHVELTVISVAIALAVSLPLAVLVRDSRRGRGAVLGTATALYTVPSLAMFGFLIPITGIGASTVVIALVLYSLTILVRGVLTGLGGVPSDVVEAARGMGMGRWRLLVRVELPLALPAIFAGLRIATVSTVALLTIGGIIGNGGLGNLIYSGLSSYFKAEVLTASVLCVVLAVVFDLMLLGVQRLLTPWRRGRTA